MITINLDSYGDDASYEIIIPYHKWIIYIDVKEGENGKSDICICDSHGIDITEEFLQFHDDAFHIKPTGTNLYQVMDLLKANLKQKEK